MLKSKWVALISGGNPVEESRAIKEISEAERLFVAKFTDAVNKSLESGTLDYDFIASEMCMTRSHLNRKLKKNLNLKMKILWLFK